MDGIESIYTCPSIDNSEKTISFDAIMRYVDASMCMTSTITRSDAAGVAEGAWHVVTLVRDSLIKA